MSLKELVGKAIDTVYEEWGDLVTRVEVVGQHGAIVLKWNGTDFDVEERE